MAVWCLLTCPVGFAQAVESLSELEERAFQHAVAAADPSIVRIETVGGFDLVGDMLTATGPTTGVVVSTDGYIITSRFNFISRPATIVVTLADERKLPAVVAAEDLSRSLTLLKVEATNLVPLPVADPGSAQVGSWALALGRTFDLNFPNLSVGIISAVKRLNGRALQTDAKVSPLNYGGPLIDLHGQGLGILVPLSPQQDGETAGVEWYDGGIGFAVPLADVYAVLPRLQAGETLHRGLIGIQFKEDGPLAGEPKVLGIRPESPGDKAGLLPGDVILSVDGELVTRVPLLKRALGRRYAGEKVVLGVRRGEQSLELTVELAAELLPYKFPALGFLPERPAFGTESTGVGVRAVLPGTPAEMQQLQPGDVIHGVQGTEVANIDALLAALRGLRPKTECALKVRRGEQDLDLSLTLAALTAEPPAVLEPIRVPVAIEPMERPPVGRLSETLAGRDLKYWAYVPESYQPAYPLGLLVWVHPSGDPLEAELLRLCKDACEQRGILLLGPLAEDVAGWSADDAEAVVDLVHHMQERYRLDPHRIAVCAHGDAVPFAFQLAFKNRELFHAAIASSGVSRQQLPDNDPDFRVQLMISSFEEDDEREVLQKFAAILKSLEFPVFQPTFAGAEANGLTPEWAETLTRWLDTLDRI